MRILARAFTDGGMSMHMKKIFYGDSLLADTLIFLLSIISHARVSPIKVNLLKINQNKRIFIACHTLWHIDNKQGH